MAGEAQAVDIAQKPTPDYVKTVLGHLQQQAQPQSFWEHNAASFIPLVGPIAHSLANDRRQARINQATMNTGLFDTLVQQGYLPDGPEATAIGQKLGIPDAVLRAGILESAKVRATPGYQGRQLFQQAMPSWTENQPFVTRSPNDTGNAPYAAGYATPVQAQGFTDTLQKQNTDRHLAAFRTFAEQNPEVFGALGSPDTGRLAIEAGEYAKADALSDYLGLPRGGTAPGAPAQSPSGASTSPPSVPPRVSPPVPLPGPPTGSGQPAQPPEQSSGGQQSSQVPFVSPAVIQARKAYTQLTPDVRQQLNDAVTAATAKYPGVTPAEVLAIGGIESGFNASALGPMTRFGWQAKGIMQLSPDVLTKYGVKDPFNLAENVLAGTAEYSRLKGLYGGDQQRALAAYNSGEGTVQQYGPNIEKVLYAATRAGLNPDRRFYHSLGQLCRK